MKWYKDAGSVSKTESVVAAGRGEEWNTEMYRRCTGAHDDGWDGVASAALAASAGSAAVAAGDEAEADREQRGE